MTVVDLHFKINNADHWTNEISTERLIVRRGQPFLLTLQTSNPESLELTVQTGPEPAEDLGTKSVFGVSRESVGKKPWKAEIKEASGTAVTLFITSPADACIGTYTLSVKTDPSAAKGQDAVTFVLLFNPWCKEDSVYLINEDERQEYVMNEHGVQFTGTSTNISGLAWDFGQFEEDILDICLKILDYNPKYLENPAEDFSERYNPIYVGRVVSAMVNSNDDKGVLQGNWSGDYSGGVSPVKWTGSVDILRQWNESDGLAVKYGQCWVFGGVMCTVMRCLGIPCRLISNFQSAHDVHGNLLIDYFFTERGAEDSMNHDSIWNFHVWTECWMRRPDLSGSEDSTYDGWQVLDPTPQELSDGVFCCGPAPVAAIREGHTELNYDVPFVYAEVNADWVAWKIQPDGSHVRYYTEKHHVGQQISTKAVGTDNRSNVTLNYKYQEGSDWERKAFNEAVERNTRLNKPEPAPEPLPEISVKIKERSKPVIGTDIDVVIRLLCSKPRNLMVYANAQAMRYNGRIESDICFEDTEVQLLANEELKIPFPIPFSKYGDHLQGNNSILVSVLVDDKDNPEEVYLGERNIAPENLPISVTIDGEPTQNKPWTATMTLQNPSPLELTNCTATFSGSGLLKEKTSVDFPSVGPGLDATLDFTFSPYKSGTKTLCCTFACDQFQDIHTSCQTLVLPSSD